MERVRQVKIVITGNQGYLGSVLSGLLRERGHHVLGYDTGFFISSSPQPRQDVRKITGSHLVGCDAVVNLAALCNDACGDLSSRATHEINEASAVDLAVLARSVGIKRYVQVSSCSVYGAAGESEVNESSLTVPQTAYAESKINAERSLSLIASHSFSVVALRLATLFGASPSLRSDVLLNRMIGTAIRWKSINVSGDGSIRRPLLHVADAAHAIETVLTAEQYRLPHMVYNVGANEQNYCLEEIAELVKEAHPQARIHRVAALDQRSYRVRFDRFREAFPEWAPIKTPADALPELFDAYRRALADCTVPNDHDWGVTDRREHLLALQSKGLLQQGFYWARQEL